MTTTLKWCLTFVDIVVVIIITDIIATTEVRRVVPIPFSITHPIDILCCVTLC
jgi:hypothetical protein